MSIRVMTQVWDSGPEDQTEMLVMLALADHADDYGRSWPSVSRIAKKCRISERTVFRTLNKLKEDGWLEIGKRGKVILRNSYQIVLSRFSQIGVILTPIDEEDTDTVSCTPCHSVTPTPVTVSPHPCHSVSPIIEPSENRKIEPPKEPSAVLPQPKKLEIGKALVQLFSENFTRVDQVLHIRALAKSAVATHGYDTVMATALVWIEANRTHPGGWPIKNFLNSRLLRDGGVTPASSLPAPVADEEVHKLALELHKYSDGYLSASKIDGVLLLRPWIAKHGADVTLRALQRFWDREGADELNRKWAMKKLRESGELDVEALADYVKDQARMESIALQRVEEERARLKLEDLEREKKDAAAAAERAKIAEWEKEHPGEIF